MIPSLLVNGQVIPTTLESEGIKDRGRQGCIYRHALLNKAMGEPDPIGHTPKYARSWYADSGLRRIKPGRQWYTWTSYHTTLNPQGSLNHT